MNTAEITNIVDQTEDVETTIIRPLDISPKAAQGVMRGTRLRYGLLLGIALLAAALAFVVLNLNKEINTQFDQIQANMASPVFHH